MDLVGQIGVGLSLDYSGYTAGAQQAVRTTQESAATIQQTWNGTLNNVNVAWSRTGEGIRRGTRQHREDTEAAGKATNAFGDSLKNWYREERGERRMGGFLSRELMEIIPAAGMAKEALGSLAFMTASMAGGTVGFGAIAAGAGLLIKTYSELIDNFRHNPLEDMFHQWRMAAVEAGSTGEEALIRLAARWKEARLAIATRDPAALAYGKVEIKLEEDLAAAKERTTAAQDKYNLLRDKALRTKAPEDQAAATTQGRLVQNLMEQENVLASTQAALREKAQLDLQRELALREQALGVGRMEISLQVAGARGWMVGEYASRLQDELELRRLRLQLAKAETEAERELIRAKIRGIDDVANARRAAKEDEQARAATLGAGADFYAMEAEAQRKFGSAEVEAEALGEARRKVQGKRYIEWASGLGEKAGEALGAAFSSGKFRPLEAVKALLTAAFGELRKYAINAITTQAGVAGAEAAASQASIPFAGPAMAAAAMSAMISLLMGLISMIPSAAGGFDVPSGLNPLTQLHGGEMVLPADLAERIRSGHGGGQVVVNQHFQTWDGASTRRTLRATRGELARAIRELQNDRRRG